MIRAIRKNHPAREMKLPSPRVFHGLWPVRPRAGFTLIELLIVIVLLGLLLAMALPSFNAVLQRYRVSTAATQIANALQFARIEAIRTSDSITVSRIDAALTDPGCTSASATDWHCGIYVYKTAGVPLRTVPTSSLNAVNVRITTATVDAAAVPVVAGAENTLVYSPMGYTSCAVGAGCALNTPSGLNSFIHVWPAGNDTPPTAPNAVVSTICATMAGQVRVVSSYVDADNPASNPGQCQP